MIAQIAVKHPSDNGISKEKLYPQKTKQHIN